MPSDRKGLWQGDDFGQERKEKASEPEGSEAFIPVTLLVALSRGDAETASGDTRRHRNASSEVSSRYSHSFTLDCRGGIPVGSSWVVGFDRHSSESRHVPPRGRLGQILGQNRKLFRNREPAVSFFVPGTKNELVLRLGIDRNKCQNSRFSSLLPV